MRWLLVAGMAGWCGGVACDDGGTAREPAVTWHRDVAPLLGRHCNGCHVAGGAGPMRLDTFEDARHHAALALGAIETGLMPPWMPAADCQPLADQRRMSDAERALFRAWVDADMPEGDAHEAPPAVSTGATDFVATEEHAVADHYLPGSEGEDDYHCFVLDRVFDEDTYVVASHLTPGSGQVHHAVVYAIKPGQLAEVAARDAAEEGPGYACFAQPISTGFAGQEAFVEYLAGGPLPNFDFPIQLGAWVPGVAPRVLPAGSAYRVPAGSKLVVQVHYSLQGAPAPDDTRLALMTTRVPPTSLLRTRPLAILDLDIPAGAPRARNTRAFPYYGARPLEVVGVMAHMHLLGSAFEAELQSDARDTCLLAIPRWDFHWQESYRFAGDPVEVADGDRVAVTCEYDNSATHQAPAADGVKPAPRDVTWGESTRDEMCIFYYTTTEPFTPPEAPATTSACEAAAPCIAGCERDGHAAVSLDCVLACSGASADCQLCSVRAALQCSELVCLGTLSEAADCLVTCLESSLMLGANLGRCLAAECSDGYEKALQCLDPALGTTSCRAKLETCGVGFAAAR